MINSNQTIFIIDDEPEVCQALRWLFESVQYQVETYETAQDFLKTDNSSKQGCLVTDVRLPGMSGLELLEQLKVQKNHLPVIIVTGHGDIQMAVRAMKAGAVDFILKPFNDQCLLEVVQNCINHSLTSHSVQLINERINSLSDRERQIIDLILNGKLNKEIAYELSISISTVEAHRANLMHKMQAKTLAHLVKLYLEAQFSKEEL